MKNVSLLLFAMTLTFMFTSCNEDSLTDQVSPSANVDQPDIQGAVAECKPLDIEQSMEFEFEVTEAKGVKVDFVRPGALRIRGSQDATDATFGPVTTTLDVIYQFFTDYAHGTAIVVEQSTNDFVELRLAGRQVTVGKNAIVVPVIGVRGAGQYREYNTATGEVTIEFNEPLDEVLGVSRGMLSIVATLDCTADDHF
jgi:hypothetical protein